MRALIRPSLGLGDLIPSGAIRLPTGMEALSGLQLFTGSASFTLIEMPRLWRSH